MVRLWGVEDRVTEPDRRPAEPNGGNPKQADGFFSDPATDRFAAAFLRLASEHWVQAEKMANLVRLLEKNQLIDSAELERVGQEANRDPERDRAVADFMRRVLGPLREDAND